jgi:micrococcal nuclease
MYNYKAVVMRVVDGDTLDVRIDLGFKLTFDTRVRLYGINTPETRTRNKKEKAAGLAAKQYVIDALAPNDDEIRLDTAKQGKFGRYLAKVWIMNNDKKSYRLLNTRLLDAGHAKEYYGGKR